MNAVAATYGDVVLRVIRREYAPLKHAAKLLAKHAGTTPRTAENWLSGINAPNGEKLVNLMAECDPLADELNGLVAQRRAERAEDERRLVNRRIRLEQELEWIKARGNARSGAHGSISGADRAHLAAATGADPESMSAARGEVDSSSERTGAEAATIADPRQLGWGW